MIYTVTLNPAVDRELTVPTLAFDTVLRASAWRVDCGGKGFNVSRMVHALGGESVALGFVGGRSGELLQDQLQALGIETNFVWVKGETRTNVSVVADENGRHLKVNEPGPTIGVDEQRAFLATVERLAKADDHWVLAGSLPPGIEPAFYGQLIAALQAVGAKVLFDSSGASLQAGCAERPFLIKPNDVELQQLLARPVATLPQIRQAAAEIQAGGVKHLIVSRGKGGALLFSESGSWHYASPDIVEKNPIGAGDSLLGGVVWGLAAGLGLEAALRWGVACGAATASLAGTAVGDRALVTRLHERVIVTPQE